MTATARRKAAEKVRAAEEACGELRTALAGVGITLPSLRIDPASCTGDIPRPLLQLGGCNLDTAAELAAALRRGCER
jgi:hypothetical protein